MLVVELHPFAQQAESSRSACRGKRSNCSSIVFSVRTMAGSNCVLAQRLISVNAASKLACGNDHRILTGASTKSTTSFDLTFPPNLIDRRHKMDISSSMLFSCCHTPERRSASRN